MIDGLNDSNKYFGLVEGFSMTSFVFRQQSWNISCSAITLLTSAEQHIIIKKTINEIMFNFSHWSLKIQNYVNFEL